MCLPFNGQVSNPYVWYIYLHLFDFMVNVGKYTSPMDAMGNLKVNLKVPYVYNGPIWYLKIFFEMNQLV